MLHFYKHTETKYNSLIHGLVRSIIQHKKNVRTLTLCNVRNYAKINNYFKFYVLLCYTFH